MSGDLATRGLEYDVTVQYGKTAEQTPSSACDCYEIICVTHGMIEYWVEDQYYKVNGGDILLVPVGTMVGSNLKQRGSPCGRYTIWLGRQFVSRLVGEDANASLSFAKAAQKGRYLLRLPVPLFDDVYHTVEAVVSECSADTQLNAELATRALITTLLVKINRLVAERGDDVLVQGEKNRLVPVLTHIHENCTQPLTVDKVAEQFGYSASHLAHSFKKQMGTSLYHYVLLRRLQIGREAMLRGTPVKEAYQLCGFGDYAGFYRAFTKEFGISPQQYKKKYS